MKRTIYRIGRWMYARWEAWRLTIIRLEIRFVETVRWFWFRLVKWSKILQLKYLLQGFPALIGFAVVASSMLLAGHARNQWVIEYEKIGQTALREGNAERARIAYERLCQSYPDRSSYLFGLALALKQSNQPERTAILIAKLAPSDRQGFPPAHLYLANQLLQKQSVDRNDISLAETHLLRVIQGEPKNASANAILGQLYYRTGRLSLAEQHLRTAEQGQPEVLLLLVRLYHQQKRKLNLESAGNRAIDYFQEQLKKDPDHIPTRLALSEILSLRGKHVEGIAVLQLGLKLRNEPVLRKHLAQSHALWVEDSSLTTSQQLAVIEQGLRIDPDCGPLLLKLAQITPKKDKDGNRARSLLQDLLARGQRSSTLYLCLGIDAQQRNQTTQAIHYLQKAFEINPQMPVVANNLAYVLAHSKKPDLQRSLQIMNEVVKRYPNDMRFRDTRGQILVKLQMWKEALADLEPCIPFRPKDRQLHKALAETYRQLGMVEPAKAHEKLAHP